MDWNLIMILIVDSDILQLKQHSIPKLSQYYLTQLKIYATENNIVKWLVPNEELYSKVFCIIARAHHNWRYKIYWSEICQTSQEFVVFLAFYLFIIALKLNHTNCELTEKRRESMGITTAYFIRYYYIFNGLVPLYDINIFGSWSKGWDFNITGG